MGYLNIPDDMVRYAGNGLIASIAQGHISMAAREIDTLTTIVKMLHPEFEEMPDPRTMPPTYKILAVPDGQVFLDSNQQVHYEKE